MFCYPENIESEANKLFTKLRQDKFLKGLPSKEFAQKSAHFLAELNAIHAFREGNVARSCHFSCCWRIRQATHSTSTGLIRICF
jgi:fido (protein-threonine AMPylation protein)